MNRRDTAWRGGWVHSCYDYGLGRESHRPQARGRTMPACRTLGAARASIARAEKRP